MAEDLEIIQVKGQFWMSAARLDVIDIDGNALVGSAATTRAPRSAQQNAASYAIRAFCDCCPPLPSHSEWQKPKNKKFRLPQCKRFLSLRFEGRIRLSSPDELLCLVRPAP